MLMLLVKYKVTLYDLAKAPWSWGRTYDILSEGCKIESRCQLEKLAIALRSKRKVKELKTKKLLDNEELKRV